MNATATKHPADCVLCKIAEPGTTHVYVSEAQRLRSAVAASDFNARLAAAKAAAGPRFRPCESCGRSPSNHNPLNTDFVGHEYR